MTKSARGGVHGGVIAVALGEAASNGRAELEWLRGAEVEWLDRAELRRRPLRTLARLWRRRYATAVLVAPDLRQRRLRLTSLVLGLPRARERWRVDAHGDRQAWSLGQHAAANALPIARHLAACALALVLARPLLSLLERVIHLSTLRPALGRAPRRVLYLRSQLWLGLAGGGSVAHTAGVIGGLQQLGVHVHAVSSDRLAGVSAPVDVIAPEVWFDGWLRELEELAYNVPFLIASLMAALRTRPDLVYQRHTAFNVAGAILASLLRIPLVLEFNSSEVWKGRYWGGLRLRDAAELVERINLRAAARVVVVSEPLRRQLVESGVEPGKILVNPNGVDPSVFRPDLGGARVRARLGLESALVVGFSGTFGVWHGIPTLADALPKLLQLRPRARWLLIGDGPLRHLVDDAVQRHGLAERVVRVGLVPHADMPEYLAACDVLVSPHGRQADGGEFFGSPTKLFEYMAAGRPIVASAVGQIAEVLEDGQSGLLVPPDDPDALCEAIVRLVDDACLRARLGAAARQAVEEQYTWRHNAAQLLRTVPASKV